MLLLRRQSALSSFSL
ncbi:hypothetical protein [Plasmodium yoelii yoelii]|uniref:Uncharacterized protein n=1 Tax=Plasmodium yoelii yoelii TaxID=73239 RepID=Q7RHM0_PLAYO|nr:hypothetical protein [Plasmodium yoelii yoelii]